MGESFSSPTAVMSAIMEDGRYWRQVKSQSWEEVQKGKGIEDTQSSNAFWDRRVGERKGRGEERRRQSASCDGQAVSHVWGCITSSTGEVLLLPYIV